VATVSGTGANYTSAPQVATASPYQPAVHIGGICTFGIFCTTVPNANRNLADSIAIAIDPAGGANVVWTNDNVPGGPVIQFACQDRGPSAYAKQPRLSGCFTVPAQ
jgi:hypothetical protein